MASRFARIIQVVIFFGCFSAVLLAKDINLDLTTFVRASKTEGITSQEVWVEARLTQSVDSVVIRVTADSWKTSKDHPLTKTKDGFWRGKIGQFPPGQVLELAGFATDDRTGRILWDNDFGANRKIEIPKASPSKEQTASPSNPVRKEEKTEEIERETKKMVSEASASEVRSIKELPDLQKFLQGHKLYVSLTTSPTRIHQLHHVINTLDLSFVDQVIVSIPKRFGRTKETYEIPEDLKLNSKIKIITLEDDLGPATKLLPAAEYVNQKDPDAIIITVDDDTGYPKGMVRELANAKLQNPHTAVGSSGQDLSYWGVEPFAFPRHENVAPASELKEVDVLEGFGGVAYRAGDVDVEMMKKMGASSREAFFSDDIVISAALAKHQIRRLRFESPLFNVRMVRQFPYGFNSDALHMGAGLGEEQSHNMNAEKYQKAFRGITEMTFDFSAQTSNPVHWLPTRQNHCVDLEQKFLTPAE